MQLFLCFFFFRTLKNVFFVFFLYAFIPSRVAALSQLDTGAAIVLRAASTALMFIEYANLQDTKLIKAYHKNAMPKTHLLVMSTTANRILHIIPPENIYIYIFHIVLHCRVSPFSSFTYTVNCRITCSCNAYTKYKAARL